MGIHDAELAREIGGYSPLDRLLAEVAVQVQLSPTDHQRATGHADAINDWLDRDGSPLQGKITLLYPQGSFANGSTVARHSEADEFDIDLMAQLDLPSNVDPELPLSLVERAIRGERGSRYYDKVDRKTRCVTVNYAGLHLDVTPTIRLPATQERTGYIFHSKPEEPAERKESLFANPWGMNEWFLERTKGDIAFGMFFETLSRDYAKALARAESDPIPDHIPAFRKPKPVIALQLTKRWRNLLFDREYPDRRRIPSVFLAYLFGRHAGPVRGSLADELIHQVGAALVFIESAENQGRLIHAVNPRCAEDVLTDRWPASRHDQQIIIAEMKAFLSDLETLRRGVPMVQMQRILTKLFGERPTLEAVRQYANAGQFTRPESTGLVVPQTGRIPTALTVLGATATPASARPIPRHTSFGDPW